MVQFWCLCAHCCCFRQRTGVSIGTLYATNCDALCILTPLYQNQHQLFQQLEQQLLVCGLDHRGLSLLLMCISEPWLPKTLLPVHHCSFLGPLLIDTDHWPGTPHKSCSFGDALTQSSSHHTLGSNLLKSLHLPFFPASNRSTMRITCSHAA